MKGLISALCLMTALMTGAAWAQPYAPNEAGVTMGHWHLNSRDIEANRKIFLAMGGTDTSAGGPLQRVTFPGVVVILNLGAGAAPFLQQAALLVVGPMLELRGLFEQFLSETS